MREVYLDNAAATAIHPAVIRAVSRASKEAGNPSAFNDAGRRARKILDEARASVAAFLHARSDELVFCSSGSEANDLALNGVLAAGKQSHVVTTAIEHPSVLETLRNASANVSVIKPDREGRVSAEAVCAAITPSTVIVSVMYANNETGAVQPIQRIAKGIRAWRRRKGTMLPYLHVDACQASAWLPVDVQALGADLLVLNGAKVHGPRGVAALYVRRGINIVPRVRGGNQESGHRAGTEDLPSIVGLAQALALVRPSDGDRIAKIQDRFYARFPVLVPAGRINSPQNGPRLPNIINVSIPDVTSEELLLALDRVGIRAGAGSACTAHRVEPSHVLVAMGVPKPYLSGALRFSLSRDTKNTDIQRLFTVLPRVIRAIQARNA